MRTCNYCGKENDDASVNCAECGTSLVASADEKNLTTEDGIRSVLRAASCFFGILVLIAFIFILADGTNLGLGQWFLFCSTIVLFLGYGFGGNGWTVWFLNFLYGDNAPRPVEKDDEKFKK